MFLSDQGYTAVTPASFLLGTPLRHGVSLRSSYNRVYKAFRGKGGWDAVSGCRTRLRRCRAR